MDTDWTQEFSLDPKLIHLNHAGVAPWPKCTSDAVNQFANENSHYSTKHISKWVKVEHQLRNLCQQLINAESSNDIALINSTSEGLSIVAYGIHWELNDNIVFAQQEFPSNRIVWQSLNARYGVEARCIDLYDGPTPEDALFKHVDQNTRLIAVSAVHYATGLRMNLEKICDYCQTNKIMLCVDAIQMLGVIPFDLNKTPADFVIADGHKWLLSPEGIGMFYCNPEIRDKLKLNQFGWHMLENANDFESLEWEPARNSRRFECGSLNNIGIHALHASLELIFKVGINNIYENISRKISYLFEKFKVNSIQILSNMDSERRSGIITVQRLDADNRLLFNSLIKANVLCAYRNSGIRFSPHFYTKLDDLDKSIDLIVNFKAVDK